MVAKFEVLDGFCAPGLDDVLPGAVVQMDERDAAYYVQNGRLKAHVEKVGGTHREPKVEKQEPPTEKR